MVEPESFPILNSTHIPSFTPVRRPRRNILCDTPTNDGDVAWTTTRCYRLIRPISSRIASLRKQRIVEEVKPTLAARKVHEPQIDTTFDENEGDNWTPNDRPRKRPRRTYSCKATAVKTNQKTAPNAVSHIRIQECLKASDENVDNTDYVANQEGSVDSLEQDGNKCNKRQYNKSRKLESRNSFRQLAKSVTPLDWMLYDGLYSSLDHLLKTTAKQRVPNNFGPRSLFSMCLNAVPHLMAEEEGKKAEDEPVEASDDISKQLYEDLEALGSLHSTGWKPLREVTRAHGISLIGQAIEDGLITPSIARGLIILCLQAFAYDEAESLCLSLIRVMPPVGEPRGNHYRLFGVETAIALQTLKDMTSQSGRWTFFFTTLTSLLEDRVISIRWMACDEMIECWNQAFMFSAEEGGVLASAAGLIKKVVSLAYQDQAFDASGFIHRLRYSNSESKRRFSNHQLSKSSMLNPSLRLDGDKTPSTTIISNLISILVSVNCSRDEGNPPPKFWIDLLQSVIVDYTYYQDAMAMCPNKDLLKPNTEASAIISFAIILLPYILHDKESADRLSSLYPALSMRYFKVPRIHETLSAFLSSLAACWSRLSCEDSSDVLRQLVDHCLDLAASTKNVTVREVCREMSTSAAFDLAEATNDIKQLDWALEVEEIVNSGRFGSPSLDDGEKLKYRWDEVICEWIAKTPLNAKSKTLETESSVPRKVKDINIPPLDRQSLVPCIPMKSFDPDGIKSSPLAKEVHACEGTESSTKEKSNGSPPAGHYKTWSRSAVVQVPLYIPNKPLGISEDFYAESKLDVTGPDKRENFRCQKSSSQQSSNSKTVTKHDSGIARLITGSGNFKKPLDLRNKCAQDAQDDSSEDELGL